MASPCSSFLCGGQPSHQPLVYSLLIDCQMLLRLLGSSIKEIDRKLFSHGSYHPAGKRKNIDIQIIIDYIKSSVEKMKPLGWIWNAGTAHVVDFRQSGCKNNNWWRGAVACVHVVSTWGDVAASPGGLGGKPPAVAMEDRDQHSEHKAVTARKVSRCGKAQEARGWWPWEHFGWIFLIKWKCRYAMFEIQSH